MKLSTDNTPLTISGCRDRKVALWGLGREGWSVLRAFERKSIRPVVSLVTDTPLSTAESAELERFTARSKIPVRACGAAERDSVLRDAEVLIKSPGVSLYRPEIDAARARGIVITSATSLWYGEQPKGKIIVVTGTKGKSTTSTLLATLLESTGAKVRLGGNIGMPLLDLLDSGGTSPDFWVVELSSYQLADAVIRPDIAILLNLYPEHIDWHGTVERYFRDKMRLLELADEHTIILRNGKDLRLESFPVLHGQLSLFNDRSGIEVRDGYFFDAGARLFPATVVPLFGEHNLVNACAALAAYAACGFDPSGADAALASMKSLPHRLSPVAESNGVLFIDDSISTVPQSALAAFAAFSDRPITALLGGFERAQDWDELAAGVVAHGVRRVITLPDSGPKIVAALRRRKDAATIPVYEAGDLELAVENAIEHTVAPGVVLLSPAAPSYGRFKNFEERGDRFKEIVLRKLSKPAAGLPAD